ncbi:ATP-dependent nuclease [Hyphomonas atlantica corrig.]|uniref:ATP-dependent nuclease n=1 Tax=Hyphomonas atlantica TaxID=1280948 RepID=UPI002353A7CA|nr:AAA family ATPase [Hyphomonas atlantica]
MKIDCIEIRNFRRLENVCCSIEENETVFVGPNNSGKTSATAIFRCFLGYRKFQIYDFSVSKITDIDAFGNDGNAQGLPAIELDIWFQVDPETIEFGRAFALLPNLSDDFDRLGVRLTYGVAEPQKLREAYLQNFPPDGENPHAKRLSQYLAESGNLNQHFGISYASLERTAEGVQALPLEQTAGKQLLQSLIRIDFVDAQRNIDDDEGHRSNRLSNAFAGFYRSNLDQVEAAAEAQKVIDENNQKLSEHYELQFAGLMKVIKDLGVPSANDRDLKIVSTLSPEAALRGNTDLLYVDASRGHELPEVYNGLGFKNLIYMAIQAKHFHSQWLRTPANRPMCHVIFIEEPEVHLHAQVQQTFIQNIWEVIEASAQEEGEAGRAPQLVITTHSSHVLDATDFGKVRYFRRCRLEDDPDDAKILNATEIHSLKDFQPEAVKVGDQVATETEALEFLKRYLRLTHCDLFFADAAILVEGAAEKLLLSAMINKTAKRLNASYLTILEIGGAYAHRFDELLTFLQIPSLIITDLDSVSPQGRHPACRADEAGALTSNASLKRLLGVSTVAELNALTDEQKSSYAKSRYISFQSGIAVHDNGTDLEMWPRTLEEAIAYQNFGFLRGGDLSIGIDIPDGLGDAYEEIWRHIGSGSFKKTDFAMELLAKDVEWNVPEYIAEGLRKLEERLHGPQDEA